MWYLSSKKCDINEKGGRMVHLFDFHVPLASRVSGQIFGISLQLHSYTVYASSDYSGETVDTQSRQSRFSSLMR